MGLILSLLFGFLPMLAYAWFVYWLDRYEKEPRSLLGGAFLWGALVAAGGAFLVNTFLGMGVFIYTNSEAATDLTTGSLIAPVVEESLKGFAVLLVFLIYRYEFDSILDGLIYAAVTALGFAATENAYYIYTQGFQENGLTGLYWLAFVRVILVGWQHPFYTSFIGIGTAIARLNRNTMVKIIAPIAGWTLAVFTHSLHNTLSSLLPDMAGLILGTFIDWSGWGAMFLFVLWTISRERRLLEQYLQEETASGTITRNQFRTACSAWSQSLVKLKARISNDYQATRKFYQLCGELAHKKHQLSRLGEEGRNSAIIESLRLELHKLSPRARSA